MVLFAVNITVSRKFMGTKTVLLGQNVFPLTSLKSGKQLKYITNIKMAAVVWKFVWAAMERKFYHHTRTSQL